MVWYNIFSIYVVFVFFDNFLFRLIVDVNYMEVFILKYYKYFGISDNYLLYMCMILFGGGGGGKKFEWKLRNVIYYDCYNFLFVIVLLIFYMINDFCYVFNLVKNVIKYELVKCFFMYYYICW